MLNVCEKIKLLLVVRLIRLQKLEIKLGVLLSEPFTPDTAVHS